MRIAAAAVMAVLGTAYVLLKKRKKGAALACKAGATSMPAFLLLAHLQESGISPALCWSLAAILLYMAADVLLECKFVYGAATFAAGHICMTAGLLSEIEATTELVLWGMGAFLLFAGAAVLVLHPYVSRLKKLKVPAFLYVAVLSAMSAVAVAAGASLGGVSGAACGTGGVSFVASDILLGKNRLGRRRSPVRGALILVLYYLSVYLFAMRIWIR